MKRLPQEELRDAFPNWNEATPTRAARCPRQQDNSCCVPIVTLWPPSAPDSAISHLHPQGLVRLPCESGAGSFTQSSSSSAADHGGVARKASLSRLPDDSSPRVGRAATDASGTSTSSTGQRSKLRERLNKNLTVATTHAKMSQKKSQQAFRRLPDNDSIDSLYDFGKEIYSGGAKGRVLMAKRKSDGKEVVVKVRTKHNNWSGEISWKVVMSQLHSIGGNDHVLDIIEIIETNSSFFVVMPKCNGGELFEFLTTETEVPEEECKRILREILTAVGHLHKNHLIHRDIKPENIMFDMDKSVMRSPKSVKLIDFDTCAEWSPMTPKTRRFVGTPGYIAPEALLGELSPQSDLWSIGVILYILMTGEMPWSNVSSLEDGVVGSPAANQMYNALKCEVLDWEQEPWPDFPLARDLCQKLLAFDTEARIGSVLEALAHPWLRSS